MGARTRFAQKSSSKPLGAIQLDQGSAGRRLQGCPSGERRIAQSKVSRSKGLRLSQGKRDPGSTAEHPLGGAEARAVHHVVPGRIESGGHGIKISLADKAKPRDQLVSTELPQASPPFGGAILPWAVRPDGLVCDSVSFQEISKQALEFTPLITDHRIGKSCPAHPVALESSQDRLGLFAADPPHQLKPRCEVDHVREVERSSFMVLDQHKVYADLIIEVSGG